VEWSLSQFNWTFPGGRLIDNFATLGAVATISFTVPAGKTWLVFGGTAERDVNATFIVEAYNSADKLLGRLGSQAAGVTSISWGTMNAVINGLAMQYPFQLRAGDYIKYTWGAAQTTPEVRLNVLEYPG